VATKGKVAAIAIAAVCAGLLYLGRRASIRRITLILRTRFRRSRPLSNSADFSSLPKGYSGGISTDRIDVLAQILKR